jgi:hypothetical protein
MKRLAVLDRQDGMLGSQSFAPLVKTSDFLKYAAADRTASGPERRSLRITVLMNEMMEQVSILRDDVPGSGRGIIGAKDSIQLWMLFEYLCNAAHGSGRQEDVCIDKKEDLPPPGATSTPRLRA